MFLTFSLWNGENNSRCPIKLFWSLKVLRSVLGPWEEINITHYHYSFHYDSLVTTYKRSWAGGSPVVSSKLGQNFGSWKPLQNHYSSEKKKTSETSSATLCFYQWRGNSRQRGQMAGSRLHSDWGWNLGVKRQTQIKRALRNRANAWEHFARITELQDFRATRNDHAEFASVSKARYWRGSSFLGVLFLALP